MDRMRKKGLKTTVLILLFLVSASLPGAMAFLKDESASMQNTLTAAQVSAELQEEFDGTAAAKFVPGQEIKKTPRVVNTSTIPAYLAMKVQYVSNGDVTAEQMKQDYIALIGLDLDCWELHTQGLDYAVYYYKTPVEPGESTGALFEKVRISSEWIDPCGFDIVLTAAAIQTESRAPADAAELLSGNMVSDNP